VPDRKTTSVSKTKYIFVSGGVISGIGKGLTSASIAFLLKQAGYRVAPIKFENYLNLDAGTINPIEHGIRSYVKMGQKETWDIGTYEKFLNEDMGHDNFVTIGRIYQTVIDRERRFEYKGEDVEAIPISPMRLSIALSHSGRRKKRIFPDELGGTARRVSKLLYYEASRL